MLFFLQTILKIIDMFLLIIRFKGEPENYFLHVEIDYFSRNIYHITYLII